MRCSKCGYISFDHLDTCRKCHKSMTRSEVKGTTYAAVAPSFLQFSEQQIDTSHESGIEEDMVDVLDPDLDVLVDESGEISPGDEFDLAFDSDSQGADLSVDEDDLMIDTSRFEAVPVNVRIEQPVPPPVIPEELADISDLARPASAPEPEVKSDFDLSFEDDLSLDDLDLTIGGQKGGGVGAAINEDELATLSLDDIDLSGALGSSPQSTAASRPVSDDDLDIDLDLGDLGGQLSTGTRKKKGGDDLPDITLSLD